MQDNTVILSSAYLPPVEYMSYLFRCRKVIIDIGEHYVKQTYRNRCTIMTANGIQDLTVPVRKPEIMPAPMKDIRISDHGNWKKLHMTAIDSSYGGSPYWDFLKADFAKLFEKEFDFLADFNTELTMLLCELMDISPEITIAEQYVTDTTGCIDLRNSISPKQKETTFEAKPYSQVFESRYGFTAGLSCIDLLLNMGRESIFYL